MDDLFGRELTEAECQAVKNYFDDADDNPPYTAAEVVYGLQYLVEGFVPPISVSVHATVQMFKKVFGW
jgi:hypothetical protein